MEAFPGRSIFLAEDDLDDQEFLIEALHELDSSLQIHVADSGDKAIEYLQSLPLAELPQLIVLDYNLPKLNGFQILSFLKSDPRFSGVTKLVWSTSNSPLYQQRCIQEGATAYLVKPTDLGGIKEVAAAILSHCPPQ
jgi:CheY-like chemotaxis protein